MSSTRWSTPGCASGQAAVERRRSSRGAGDRLRRSHRPCAGSCATSCARSSRCAAIGFLTLFYACGLFAPLVAPHDPYTQRPECRRDPAGAIRRTLARDRSAWAGTLLSRVVYAARTTVVFTAVVLVSGGLLLGLGLGLLAGYRGGWVDTLIMRVGEVLAGLPTLLLMLAITAAFRTRINDVSFWLQDNTWLGGDARTLVKFSIIVVRDGAVRLARQLTNRPQPGARHPRGDLCPRRRGDGCLDVAGADAPRHARCHPAVRGWRLGRHGRYCRRRGHAELPRARHRRPLPPASGTSSRQARARKRSSGSPTCCSPRPSRWRSSSSPGTSSEMRSSTCCNPVAGAAGDGPGRAYRVPLYSGMSAPGWGMRFAILHWEERFTP